MEQQWFSGGGSFLPRINDSPELLCGYGFAAEVLRESVARSWPRPGFFPAGHITTALHPTVRPLVRGNLFKGENLYYSPISTHVHTQFP